MPPRRVSATVLHLESIGFGYRGGGEVVALDALDVAENDSVLVIGPSGCGKTTLLHLIAGLLLPARGKVVVRGQDLIALTPAQRDRFRGRNVGMVLQQFHLLPSLTALQNLTVAQSVAGWPVDRAGARALLDALGVSARPDAFPHALSVGQQQRVAIARALVNRPALLLADEPTSNLDDEACDAVAGLLLDASRKHGTALVIATHDSRLRARFATEVRLPRRESAVAA